MSREAIRDYVRQALRDGFTDREFFGLRELGEAAIPELIEQFRISEEQRIRVNLVQVLWQTRSKSTLPFLLSLLNEPDDEIWNEALDGIVAIGGPEAKSQLAYQLSLSSGERRERIEEAFTQMSDSQP